MADKSTKSLPSEEEKEDLLLACRYGDLEDVQTFVDEYSPSSLEDVIDQNGNSILHMISANGHQGSQGYDTRNHIFTDRCKQMCYLTFSPSLLPLHPS